MKNYSWFEVYRAALLELDSSQITARVAVARQKLKERMQMPGLSDGEQHAITDALNVLYAVEMTARRQDQSAVSDRAVFSLRSEPR